MILTTEKLLTLARKEAESRHGIVSGYVIGSAAGGDPVFGGTADVDLVLIHEYEPALLREIVPLSDEVHLDITHHSKRRYERPRELRVDPWLGPAMCEPIFLHDPTHFFEWAQASVRGQFHRPDNVLARSKAFLRRAHTSMRELEGEQRWLRGWLRALLETSNAVASLEGFPAAGRRLMPQLESKLTAVGHPEIHGRFLRLLGAERFVQSEAEEWVTSWTNTVNAASKLSSDPELAAGRRDYYLGGYLSMIEEGSAVQILWPLLATWDRAIHAISLSSESQLHWSQVLDTLELSIDHASRREAELYDLMDQVEGVLENWAERVGA
ncbi:MAG: hypothetical protein IH953_07825 [Chloroflexi bacterium]|nr:hypothetical protein [Chloroflexota bacterium]